MAATSSLLFFSPCASHSSLSLKPKRLVRVSVSANPSASSSDIVSKPQIELEFLGVSEQIDITFLPFSY
jgi:hypothetical protein